MFTSFQTYCSAVNETRFMLAVGRPWGQGRLHVDADIITLAGRSLR